MKVVEKGFESMVGPLGLWYGPGSDQKRGLVGRPDLPHIRGRVQGGRSPDLPPTAFLQSWLENNNSFGKEKVGWKIKSRLENEKSVGKQKVGWEAKSRLGSKKSVGKIFWR